MSEPFAERLSRFTPDAGKLDRDALLFAAGRASARPRRPWMALSGALAASQLATLLFFLWPHTPAVAPPMPPTFPVAVRTPETPAEPEPSSWLSVRQQLVAAEGNPPAPTADDSLVPQDPPLRAFGSPPSALLN